MEVTLAPYSITGSTSRLQTEGEDPSVEGIDIGDVKDHSAPPRTRAGIGLRARERVVCRS